MSRYWLPILLAMNLSGCATLTPAERAARMQVEVEEMIKIYGPACEKLGYSPDSDEWRDCILRLSAKEEFRYRTYPMTTNCVGHRGFYNCTTF